MSSSWDCKIYMIQRKLQKHAHMKYKKQQFVIFHALCCLKWTFYIYSNNPNVLWVAFHIKIGCVPEWCHKKSIHPAFMSLRFWILTRLQPSMSENHVLWVWGMAYHVNHRDNSQLWTSVLKYSMQKRVDSYPLRLCYAAMWCSISSKRFSWLASDLVGG